MAHADQTAAEVIVPLRSSTCMANRMRLPAVLIARSRFGWVVGMAAACILSPQTFTTNRPSLMKTLGRIVFLLLSIAAGLWLAFGCLGVYASLKHPDAVAGAMGAATLPLLFFVFCVWCFRKLGPVKVPLVE
jgi:uncharacterized protein with PQ loop repeat